LAQHLLATDEKNIEKTAVALQQGHLVVIPTDTVYGIGADAFNGEAIQKLYRAKERPLDKGIPILLADVSDLYRVARHIPTLSQTYIQQFWPGPLTLIVPKHPDLPGIISPNDGIAVRIPACEVARAVIRAAGGAVAASSANRSNNPPAQTADQALAELGDWVAVVLDDGRSPGGTASTIINCLTDTPQLLRTGPITADQLQLTMTL
jgi:L-threonylcarbamoyladenylate synthase